jgi:recombination protein RecR
MYSSKYLELLIDELVRLPSIGHKSAQRLALHILRAPKEDAVRLAEAIRAVKERVGYCQLCGNFSEENPCRICTDPARDAGLLCVVEQPGDVIALERTGQYRGRYHVLGGALSPLDGVNPDALRIRELLERLRPTVAGSAHAAVASEARAPAPTAGAASATAPARDATAPALPAADVAAPAPGESAIREIIIATNPNVAGEATALYLSRLIAPLGVKVTRIARGVPMGSDLEYSDLVTLTRALEGRSEVE